MGNLANNQENCFAMVDEGCGKRVLEIMERLDFDEQIVRICFQLFKMLTISADVSTTYVKDNAAEIIQTVIRDNMRKVHIVRLGCQALVKLIVSVEAAKIVSTQGVVDTLVDVCKDGNNFVNAPLMTGILVFDGCCLAVVCYVFVFLFY